MKRIFVTGASGFLGGHICQQATKQWDVFGAFHRNETLPESTKPVNVDLSESERLFEVLDEIDPGVVIHAAVMQVDECEGAPDLAQRINVEATRVIAEWCGQRQRRLIYISSDLVFDGKTGWYAETDLPQPINLYGQSKHEGETATLFVCPQACVARLPLMYGFPLARGYCFFAGMFALLQRKETVAVFHDQYRTPGLVANMAEALLELVNLSFSGIIHLGGAKRCSRYEFAQALCRLSGFDEALLRPVSMFEAKTPAARPQDVSLTNKLAQRVLKTKLLGYEEGLRALLKH